MTDLFKGSILKFRKTKTLSLSEKHQIFDLWNNEYPRNLVYENLEQFQDYLNELKDQYHIILLDENEQLIGWYFDFLRDGQRWFAAILDSKFQGEGYGTKLLNLARQKRTELNGWVIPSADYIKYNGEAYRSPLEFYNKIGFKVHRNIKLETDKISAIKISWSRNSK